MAEQNKAIRKELCTVLSWGKEEVIDYKTEETEGEKYLVQIWCKLCAKYKAQLLVHPQIRGAAKKSIKAFTEGNKFQE